MGARDQTPPAEPAGFPRDAERQLLGALPCLRCGYNLRGLSVRGVCPECGTPVRATLVYRLDPLADALTPIPRPRLVAAGLIAWSGGALVAVAAWWLLVALDAVGWEAASALALESLAAIGLAISAVGAIAFISPHPGLPRRSGLAAAVAVAAYVPLGLMLWLAPGAADIRTLDFYIEPGFPRLGGTLLRLGALALVGVILAGLRPNARALTARSLLLRSGRVDRQEMLVLLAVVGVVAIGDGLRLIAIGVPGRFGGAIGAVGTVILPVGSMLCAIGLIGALIDCVRLARVIVEPLPSPTRLLGAGAGAGGPSMRGDAPEIERGGDPRRAATEGPG